MRFSDTGEVVEVEVTTEEPTKATGVPPLFANLETQYAFTAPAANAIGISTGAPRAQSEYGPPRATAVATSFGGAIGGAAPPNGYCQPSPGGGQPEISGHMNGDYEPANGGTYVQAGGQHQSPTGQNQDLGLAPPLPMGYYETDHPAPPPVAPPPVAAEPAGAFLLPVTQIDDVVGEILMGFGFESPAPVIEPPPPPVPAIESPPPPAPMPPPLPPMPPPTPPPFLVDPEHILGQQPDAVEPPQPVHPDAGPIEQVVPVVPAIPVIGGSPLAPFGPDAAPAPSPSIIPPAVSDDRPTEQVQPAASEPVVAAYDAPVQPEERTATAPELSVPAPDLITSSSETLSRKERQRREREVSMAELARDIMSISDPEAVQGDASGEEEDQPGTEAEQDVNRHASFDLVIGPAPKSGRMRRSKMSTPKDAAEELADLVSDAALDPKMAEAGAEKGRTRSRLRRR